jgi:hypothetical protein
LHRTAILSYKSDKSINTKGGYQYKGDISSNIRDKIYIYTADLEGGCKCDVGFLEVRQHPPSLYLSPQLIFLEKSRVALGTLRYLGQNLERIFFTT